MKLNQQIKTTMSLAAAMGILALAATSANAAVISVSGYVIATGAGVIVPGGGGWADSGNELNDNVTDPSNGGDTVGWDYNGGDRPLVTFDLGAVFDLSTIQVYSRTSNGTITSIDISTSLDDSTYSGVTGYAYTAPSGTINVSGEINARYVRFTPISPDWAMISEVDFNGTAVPEPSTTALLGLGGLALILRRRK